MVSVLKKRLFYLFLSLSLVFYFSLYAGIDLSLSSLGNALSYSKYYNSNDTLILSTNRATSLNATHNKIYRPIRRGSYIRVGDLDVAIVTAVFYKDDPVKNGFKIFLNGWVRHKSNMNFKCCFLNEVGVETSTLVEATANTYHVYSQWVVDMQNGEFSCTIPAKQMEQLPRINRDFNYVTFAEKSCEYSPQEVIKIERPQRVPKSIAICLKVSYGSLNPELIMEWFEYNKLLGVTKVYSFLSEDLKPDARKVFLYYNSTGFLEADPIDPAPSKNGSHRGFKHPRWSEQAFVDEVMAINDCKHRMSGFDFIIVMDIDEFIVPESPQDNIYSILKKTLSQYPKAGAFTFNSHIFMLDWGQTRNSSLHLMRFTNRTTFPNFDGASRNTRWGFISDRTYFGQNNKAWPKSSFISVDVPQSLYKLVHRRGCKTRLWKNCLDLDIRHGDNNIVRYENQMIQNIRKLPLHSILTDSKKYIDGLLNGTSSPTVVGKSKDKTERNIKQNMLPSDKTSTSSNATHNKIHRPIRRGSYTRVGDLDVAIVTAVFYKDDPDKNGFNIFLNGWVRHKSNMNFKCCFLNELGVETSNLVETTANTYHVYSQWVVDMQNGEFSCTIPAKQLEQLPRINRDFNYVTFAENTCEHSPHEVIKIERPQRVPNSVAICLKVSYGSLNPELIMEWFEYNKLLGVTKVYSFLSEDLEPDARKVFLYYNSTGFLEADPIHPAPSKKGSHRGFKHPRWDDQAFVDEVMAINDCKHRMSGFDFIIVMDIDELIVPESPKDNIYSILKKTLSQHPKAGAFSFNSHIFMLDWGETRNSSLHFMRFTNRTKFPNYDGADRNTRWGFISDRTYFGQNNKAWPKSSFTSVDVPQNLYKLVHRRLCKKSWKNCLRTEIRQRDNNIVRYENEMIENIRKLPLHSVLTNSTKYIDALLNRTSSPTVVGKSEEKNMS